MIHIRWALIFLTLFVQGCTEKFVVAEKVCIGMGKGKLAFVDFKGQEIAQITDFWMHENYLYGYRYRGSEYVLFLIDLRANRFFEGMVAHQIVHKMSLPIDRWTNAVELFGDYISDSGRRNLFIKAARDAGLGAGSGAMKRIRK